MPKGEDTVAIRVYVTEEEAEAITRMARRCEMWDGSQNYPSNSTYCRMAILHELARQPVRNVKASVVEGLARVRLTRGKP